MRAALASKSRSWTDDLKIGGSAIMTRYRRIAYISRARGLTGELVAAPMGDLPFRFKEGLQLWVVPPDHSLLRETKVRAARQNADVHAARQIADVCAVRQSTDTLYLTLEGVSDLATAQRLVGRYLLARDCDLEYETVEDGYSFPGLSVFDSSAGFIGTVVEERSGSAQLLLVVEGPHGEVLIPAVDEFIRDCDGTALHVSLPQGLLELNR